ncbi:hypothetical protein LPJ72_005433, partial [Coemansia sp. Benny D160-2]
YTTAPPPPVYTTAPPPPVSTAPSPPVYTTETIPLPTYPTGVCEPATVYVTDYITVTTTVAAAPTTVYSTICPSDSYETEEWCSDETEEESIEWCSDEYQYYRRQGNLESSSVVSDTSSVWRTYACMVQFAATDGTPLLMLYGGSDSLDADDPLSIASSGESKINILDIGGKTWYEPQTVDAPTPGPVLPGCGAEQGSIWVYDSNYGVTGMQLSPVRVLDDVHWSWSSPTEQGQLPITRFGAAFAYVPTSTQFYMHGGIPLSSTSNKADDPPGIANNLDILSPSDFSWGYASNGPARKYHTLCYIKSIDSIVLFGGSDQNIASYNDIKLYSVKTSSWSYSLDVSGNVPAQRVLHSAVCTDDSMLVFGGTHSIGDSPSDSTVWVLKANNETSFSWSKAPIASTSLDMSPSARFGHSAALYNNSMYLYGGIGPNGKDDAVYVLDVKSWEWSQISTSDSGSNRGGGSGVNTRVLIAAIVSAVLGVICVGIAAFVFYRWNRRRSTTQGKQNEHTDTKEMPRSNEYSNSGDTAAIMEASNGDFNADGYIKDIGNPVIVPGTPAGESTSNYLSQYLDPTYASTQSNPRDTAVNINTDSDIVRNNYMPSPHPHPSVESSTNIVSFYLPDVQDGRATIANSRNPGNIPQLGIPNGSDTHMHSASSTPISSDSQTQERAANTQTLARTPAEVVNSILLSGKPLPAWLREAVRRSDSEQDTSSASVPHSPAFGFTDDNSRAEHPPGVGTHANLSTEDNHNRNRSSPHVDNNIVLLRDIPPSSRHNLDTRQQQYNDDDANNDVQRLNGSLNRMQKTSVHSTETSDTQSALVYEPIMYVTVSRTSTDAPSIAQSPLKGESRRSSSYKHRNNGSYTRRQDPELSDADFASAGLQSDTAAQNVLTALSSSIAQPMSPPVPLRMNSLYGELENKGIIVGQAASPQTAVSTGYVVPEEGSITNAHASPRTAHTPHEQTDAYAVSRDLARVSRADIDDEILSPLDRLARYHAMDAWMVSGANTENTESVSQSSDSEATDDTSKIYAAHPAHRSSDSL